MNLDDLTVLNDIRERLKHITPERLEATNRKLPTLDSKKTVKGQKVIGVIEPETTRALYALMFVLNAEEKTQEALAQMAVNEIEEQDHKQQAAFLDMLHDVVKEIFWAQAKNDCGFHEKANVGLYQNWQLVKEARSSGPSGFISQMMGLPSGMTPPDEDE